MTLAWSSATQSAPLAPCGLSAGRGAGVWRNRIVGTSCNAPIIGRTEAPAPRRPQKHDAGPGGPASAMDSRVCDLLLPWRTPPAPPMQRVVMVVLVMRAGAPHER